MEADIAMWCPVVQEEMAHNNNADNINNTQITTLDLEWNEIDHTATIYFPLWISPFLSLFLSFPLSPSISPTCLPLTLCLPPYLCMFMCLCVWKYLSLERVLRLRYIVTDYQLSTAAGICWMSLSTETEWV